jgi:hypothetical protein
MMLEPMAMYLFQHHHDPTECAASFAAWKGFESPVRGTTAWCSCQNGGHRLWFVVEAVDDSAALNQLPDYRARRTIASPIAEVPIP